MTEPLDDDPSRLIDLFCRKSRAKAARGKREISISAQETRGRRVAAELGMTVRHVWREVGSASRFSKRSARKDQDAALRALERREIGALWVFQLDRWDRRGAGAILKIIEPADGLPRRLLFDNGDPENPGIGLDSTNERDREELIRRAEAARRETELLSERVRTTKTHQRENGEWVSARAPYGLKVVLVDVQDEDGDVITERKLALDDAPAGDPADPQRTKADVARWAIHTRPVRDGVTRRAVARELNAAGVPPPQGDFWTDITLRSMVYNPAYAGWQSARRQSTNVHRVLLRDASGAKVPVTHGPALLTNDEQTAAQSAQPSTIEPDRHDTRAKHVLTGLLVCRSCGASITFAGKGYRCWRRQKGAECEEPASVARLSAERYVHDRWSSRLAASEPDDPLVFAVAERWSAVVQPEATEDSAAASAALTAAEQDLARVWRDRRAGLYDGPSEAYFAPALKDATEAMVKAKDALSAAVARRGVDVGFILDPESCEGAWEAADLPMRRTLLRLAIDRIELCRAPYRGVRFDGKTRMRIMWADGTSDPPLPPPHRYQPRHR